MKRDMEVVRNMITSIAESDKKYFDEPFDIQGISRQEIEYHLKIMKDAGIIDGTLKSADSKMLYFVNLTWLGNDFYETFEDNKTWTGVKNWLSKKGTDISKVPFDIIMEMGKEYIKKSIGME